MNELYGGPGSAYRSTWETDGIGSLKGGSSPAGQTQSPGGAKAGRMGGEVRGDFPTQEGGGGQDWSEQWLLWTGPELIVINIFMSLIMVNPKRKKLENYIQKTSIEKQRKGWFKIKGQLKKQVKWIQSEHSWKKWGPRGERKHQRPASHDRKKCSSKG